jgi:hypothetical protein
MLHHIRLVPLLVGLALGIAGILFIKPEQIIQYKYPLPEQAKELVYKDKNGLCFQYVPEEENCDKNEGKLKPFPLSL